LRHLNISSHGPSVKRREFEFCVDFVTGVGEVNCNMLCEKVDITDINASLSSQHWSW